MLHKISKPLSRMFWLCLMANCMCLQPYYVRAQTSDQDKVILSIEEISQFLELDDEKQLAFLKDNPEWKNKRFCYSLILNSMQIWQARGDVSGALLLAKAAGKIGEHLSDQYTVTEAEYQMALLLVSTGEYAKAEKHYLNALEYYISTNNIPYQQDVSMSLGAIAFYLKNEPEHAIEYYRKVVIDDPSADPSKSGSALQVIGEIYAELLEDSEKATSAAIEAIKYFRKGPKNWHTLWTIGYTYVRIAKNYLESKELTKAFEAIEEAHIIAERANSDVLVIFLNVVWGRIYADFEEYDKAIDKFLIASDTYQGEDWLEELQALTRHHQILLKKEMIDSDYTKALSLIGVWAGRTENYRKGIEACQQVLEYSKTSSDRPLRVTILRQLAFLYGLKGDNVISVNYLKEALKLVEDFPEEKEELLQWLFVDDKIIRQQRRSKLNRTMNYSSSSLQNTIKELFTEANKEGMRTDMIRDLANLARFSARNPSGAFELLLMALDIDREENRIVDVIKDLEALIWVCADLGEVKLAVSYALESGQLFVEHYEDIELNDLANWGDEKESGSNLTIFGLDGSDESVASIMKQLMTPRTIFATLVSKPSLVTSEFLDKLCESKIHIQTYNRPAVNLGAMTDLVESGSLDDSGLVSNIEISSIIFANAAKIGLMQLEKTSNRNRLKDIGYFKGKIALMFGEAYQTIEDNKNAAFYYQQANQFLEEWLEHNSTTERSDKAKAYRATAILNLALMKFPFREDKNNLVQTAMRVIDSIESSEEREYPESLLSLVLSSDEMLGDLFPVPLMDEGRKKVADAYAEDIQSLLNFHKLYQGHLLNGRIEEAEKVALRFIEQASQNQKYSRSVLSFRLDFSGTLLKYGKSDRAKHLAQDALKQAKELGLNELIADSYHQLAKIAHQEKLFQDALDYYEAALEGYIDRIPSQEIKLANSLSEYAYLLIEQKFGNTLKPADYDAHRELFDKALDYQQRSLEIHRKHNIYRSVALDLYFIAQIYLLSNPDIALDHINEAGNLLEGLRNDQGLRDLSSDFLSVEWKVRFLKAQALVMNTPVSKMDVQLAVNIKRSVQELESAIDIMEELITREILVGKKRSLIHFVYDFLIEQLAKLSLLQKETGWEVKALSTVERFKARSLNQAIVQSKLANLDKVKKQHLRVIRKYEQMLKAVEADLLSTSGKPKELIEESTLKYKEKQATQIRQQIAEMKAKLPDIFGEPVRVARLVDQNIIDLISPKIKEKTVVVYFLGNSSSYLWLIQNGHVHLKFLPGRKELSPLIRDYYEFISKWPPGDQAKGFRKGKQLFEHLITPISAFLHPDEQLIIIPDSELFFLPFEALVVEYDEDKNQASHFFVHYVESITYVPSLETLNLIYTNDVFNISTKKLLAFAQDDFSSVDSKWWDLPIKPLRHTDDEIANIQGYFASSDIFKGPEATESRFKEHIHDEVDVVHIATHTWLDGKNVENSGIIIGKAPNSIEDGVLRYRELIALGPLSCQLVVLSGCQTTFTELSEIEGIVGLSRTFLENDVSTVVSSLWSVDDAATAHLMATFYEKMNSGYSVSHSMSFARKSMINAKDVPKSSKATGRGIVNKNKDFTVGYRHPYFWAPFVVYGNPF